MQQYKDLKQKNNNLENTNKKLNENIETCNKQIGKLKANNKEMKEKENEWKTMINYLQTENKKINDEMELILARYIP